jgi:radical SAM protein with 4Fe4S-binding SPASM domain
MALGFGGLWEPLLLRELPDVVAHGRERGIVDALLSTNGSLLTRELSADLIEAGLTRLMVSLDALTAPTYALVRKGGDLGVVERNVLGFLEERERRGRRLPLLRLSFMETSLNEGELPGFLGRWADAADFFSVQRYGFYPGNGRLPLFPGGDKGPVPGPCAQPFKRLLVRHDGDVLPCCDLSAVGMPVGNIYASSLGEIWEGESIRSLRDAIRKGEPPLTCLRCWAKYGSPGEP